MGRVGWGCWGCRPMQGLCSACLYDTASSAARSSRCAYTRQVAGRAIWLSPGSHNPLQTTESTTHKQAYTLRWQKVEQ